MASRFPAGIVALVLFAGCGRAQELKPLPHLPLFDQLPGVRLGASLLQLRESRPNARPTESGLVDTLGGFRVYFSFSQSDDPFEFRPGAGARLRSVAAERYFATAAETLAEAKRVDSSSGMRANVARCTRRLVARGMLFVSERLDDGVRVTILALTDEATSRSQADSLPMLLRFSASSEPVPPPHAEDRVVDREKLWIHRLSGS